MPRIKISEIDWDENNRWYATKRGISMDEIEEIMLATRDWQRNKNNRAGNVSTVGTTLAGRRIRVIASWDPERRRIRPINAWEENR